MHTHVMHVRKYTHTHWQTYAHAFTQRQRERSPRPKRTCGRRRSSRRRDAAPGLVPGHGLPAQHDPTMHGCAWPLRAHPCRWSARPPQEQTAVSASAAVSEGALFVRGYHVVYLCVYPCIDACLHRWMDGWMYLLHTHPHPLAHKSRTHKLNTHTCHIFIRTDSGLRLQTHVRAHAQIHTDRQTVGEAEAPAQPRPK